MEVLGSEVVTLILRVVLVGVVLEGQREVDLEEDTYQVRLGEAEEGADPGEEVRVLARCQDGEEEAAALLVAQRKEIQALAWVTELS